MTPPSALLGAAGLGAVAGATIDLALYRASMELGGRPNSWRRYLALLLVTPMLYVALTIRFGLTLALPAYVYLGTVGLLLAMLDFEVRRLPDSIVLPSYVITLLILMPAGAASGDWGPAQRALGGLAAFITMFFALAVAYPHAVGFGDVKLGGLLGIHLAWLGWATLLIGVLGSFVLVGFGGVMLGSSRRGAAASIPFAPCLVMASVLALFVTVPISTWYGSILGHA